MISVKICDKNNNIYAKMQDEKLVNFVFSGSYNEGDSILLTVPKSGYYAIRLDDTLPERIAYMGDLSYRLFIPFGDNKLSYSQKSFSGDLHIISARIAEEWEHEVYRNLAVNEYDSHENSSCFPHAYANVETRGEAVFAARNAIDGITANSSHGIWPYSSWGINRDPNAELTLSFGRCVTVDRLVLVTRADFPHDNWWKNATVIFSNGVTLNLEMKKSSHPHVFSFEKQEITALTLKNLIKDELDPSPFPALSQIIIFGI